MAFAKITQLHIDLLISCALKLNDGDNDDGGGIDPKTSRTSNTSDRRVIVGPFDIVAGPFFVLNGNRRIIGLRDVNAIQMIILKTKSQQASFSR